PTPSNSTLVPYTTLFRSVPLPEQFNNLDDAVEFWDTHSLADYQEAWRDVQCEIDIKRRTYQISLDSGIYQKLRRAARERGVSARSEEHTSELQSRVDLVC